MIDQHPDPLPPWETRVFFVLAACCAICFVFIWLFNLSSHISLQDYYGPIAWHNHELLFAFSTAIMSAYLFNLYPMHQRRGYCLAITISLIIIWLLARLMAFFPIAHPLLAFVDLAYLPLLSIALFWPMLRHKRFINLFFILLLLLMTLANGMIHSELLYQTKGSAKAGQTMMIYLLILFWFISGARYTIPEFKKFQNLWAYLSLEVVCILSLVLLLQFEMTRISGPYIAIISFVGCLAFLGYLVVHYSMDSKKEFKWIFDIAYAWLSLGLFLRFLSSFDIVPYSLAIHCFTAGVIGTFSLGIMIRAMQHRLNELEHLSTTIKAVIALLLMAGIFRVIMPLIFPNSYMNLIMLSGLFWIAAFSLYLFAYRHNIFESTYVPLSLSKPYSK